jgi:hypothetical protein
MINIKKGNTFMVDQTDRRASIRPKPGGWDDLLGPDNPEENPVLYPLRQKSQGLVFPYTPDVQIIPNAAYDPQNFAHSNYAFNSWQYSDPGDITITGDFTANTHEEAQYMLAVTHFLRGSMKGGFGIKDEQRGVPPGVYNFNYLGAYQFRNVPVVFTTAAFSYPKDVDYVPVNFGENQTWVPIHMSITVTLKPQFNVKTLRDNFTLSGFRKGDFLKNKNSGGFI